MNEPEICAPVAPSIPSGFSWKLISGAETSSSSSTIAKCCEAFPGSSPGSELSAPRWAISAVILANAARPLSVKLKVTIGSWPPVVESKFCSGSLMSVPESAGLSSMIQNRSGGGSVGLVFSSRTTRIPSGTFTTSAFARTSGVRSSSAASSVSDGCELFSGAFEILLNA